MEKYRFEEHFIIDKNSPVPVYQQLTDAVLDAINADSLLVNDKMPSINALAKRANVSRATIEKSYSDLRDLGVLGAHHGKGFFIQKAAPSEEIRVLLLFHQLNSYNRLVFNSLNKQLGSEVTIDFDIYDNSAARLDYLLKKRSTSYAYYVIVPNFLDDPDHGFKLINRLPKSKLILLDKMLGDVPPSPGL